jgi:hypothetical protein
MKNLTNLVAVGGSMNEMTLPNVEGKSWGALTGETQHQDPKSKAGKGPKEEC